MPGRATAADAGEEGCGERCLALGPRRVWTLLACGIRSHHGGVFVHPPAQTVPQSRLGKRWLHDGQPQGDSWRCQAHSVQSQDQSPRCQPAAHTTGVRKRALGRRAPHPPAVPGDILEDHQSLISKWAKEEDKLVKLAASEETKTLLATQQPKRWFPEAESKLYELFLACRKKKLKVSTLWLTATFRKLLQEMYPTDYRAAAFRPSFRWMRKWAKAHLLSKRRRSNSKNKSVEERLPAIQRFRSKFRKLLIQPVRRRGAVFPEDRPLEMAAPRPAGETRLEKYGQFLLSERFNVDQVPLPFVNGQSDTLEKTGEKRVAIAQPFAGLKKRQCTMQVIFGPGSRLMRISVIFRGTGKRISPVEKAAYHKNVDVFFHENAWADHKFCMEWAQRSYRKSLIRGRSHLPQERSILLMDILHAQTTDAFKEFRSEHCNTLAWYFPANKTDQVQPVDAGVGRMLKVEVGRQLDIWLGQADNLEKWESNKLTASDRRVLITQWVGPAMDIVDSRPDYRFRLFENCGMAMTVDGSGDERITLEGLNKPYSFMDAEDSSEDEKVSETGSDDDESVEDGGTDLGGGGDGDNSGKRMEDDDSSYEDDDGKFNFRQIDIVFLRCCRCCCCCCGGCMVFVCAGVLLWSSVFLVFVCAGVGAGVGVGVPFTLKISFDELLFSINDEY